MNVEQSGAIGSLRQIPSFRDWKCSIGARVAHDSGVIAHYLFSRAAGKRRAFPNVMRNMQTRLTDAAVLSFFGALFQLSVLLLKQRRRFANSI
jgi:hypothetical protein